MELRTFSRGFVVFALLVTGGGFIYAMYCASYGLALFQLFLFSINVFNTQKVFSKT